LLVWGIIVIRIFQIVVIFMWRLVHLEKNLNPGELVNKREPFVVGDTIGVGFFKNQFFITKNGKMFGRAVHINKTYPISGLYPTISFTDAGVSLQANFGNSLFKYDLNTIQTFWIHQPNIADKLLNSDSLSLIISYMFPKTPKIDEIVMTSINLSFVSRWWYQSITTGNNNLWKAICFSKWDYLSQLNYAPPSWFRFFHGRLLDRNTECYSAIENCHLLLSNRFEDWEPTCPKFYERTTAGRCTSCDKIIKHFEKRTDFNKFITTPNKTSQPISLSYTSDNTFKPKGYTLYYFPT